MWTFALLGLTQVVELELARQHQFDMRQYLVAVLVAAVDIQHGAPVAVCGPEDTPVMRVNSNMVVALPIVYQLRLEA